MTSTDHRWFVSRVTGSGERQFVFFATAVENAGSVLALHRFVECRIEVREEDGELVVRLAGRLAEPQVAALLEACSRTKKPPRLELDDLISADAMGIDALQRLELRGAQLIGLPTYLRLKLDAATRDRRR